MKANQDTWPLATMARLLKVSRSGSAWILWYQGYADQARERSQEALALAQKASHHYSLAQCLVKGWCSAWEQGLTSCARTERLLGADHHRIRAEERLDAHLAEARFATVVFRRGNDQCLSICTGVDEVWLDRRRLLSCCCEFREAQINTHF
ncbi:protein of unknown function (plasmid) [Cupriavidus taiwanensis]|uniref:Uncharacterized protein n=1 Tax=Cupriavidus taiwanensis TaxID=164546 RepID=A0A7Z7NQJ7_9BURK|nr:hypothetical protein CBM2597_U50012 [Cupriavidus taiwanensis]SOZ97257.1 hypothetical protein CBM2598_U50013 [Cupriavidus taiwanensis]SPC26146.1 hypothetical protein CBM2594_U60012 [Cupriavidus taiwanensis]SPD37719.1 protein of unknown function [Cupriavidus taiwanensis]